MKTILIFLSSTRPSCRARLEGAFAWTTDRGWHLQTVECGYPAAGTKELLDVWHPVGAIVDYGSGAGGTDLRLLRGLPLVFSDSDPAAHPGGHCVCADSRSVAETAAHHLLSLDLPNYAYVSFHRKKAHWSRERERAFVAALARAGRGCIVCDSVVGLPPGKRQKALRDWLLALPKPCGVFAANDYVAEDVVNLCVLLGVSVPEEVAVLGVDDNPAVCETVEPSLSSVSVDFRRGGYLSADLLGRLVENPGLPPACLTYGALGVTVRRSTRRIPCDRRRIAEVVEFVRRNACGGISVRDAVAKMGVPRRTAEVHFREVVGRTIHEEIDEVRFARVFELLRNPRQSLEAVHALCGFSTGVALRKAFRQRTGMSMRDWRKTFGIG